MSTSESYIFQDALPDSSDDIDSLPSSDASSETDTESQSDAQKEWEESLQQIELLLTMVVVPYLGKFFGRKAAYWGWTKYMTWYYPVEVRYTSKPAFDATGAVAAATL